jgi:tryptophan synthase alpha chain
MKQTAIDGNRLSILFTNKRKGVLNIYCTAGFPELDSTLEVMQALQEAGADIIELGMPYSDPLADGPVIQASSAKALANGMSIQKLFEQLKSFRQRISIPVILMGYMNPVLQYGFERFCADAADVGIDALILPDLPIHEFENSYATVIRSHGLGFIFLVTPETSQERVRKLDELSTGFLYAVSSSSTTGSNKQNSGHLTSYIERLKSAGVRNPVLVGFGIGDNKSFREASSVAEGAVVGTAYIRALMNGGDIGTTTKEFVQKIVLGE